MSQTKVYLWRSWYSCQPCGCPKGSTCISKKLRSHPKKVRDDMATPLEWTNRLSCSGLNICSLLTKTWECPVSSPQDLWLVCLWVSLMVFKGVKYFKVSLVLNLFLLSQKLFNSCQAWAFVYCFIPSTVGWKFSVCYCLLPISFYLWSLFIMVRKKNSCFEKAS